MSNLGSGARRLLWIAMLACLPGWAQQEVPDNPKPKVAPQQFPTDAPPAPKNVHPDQATDTPGTTDVPAPSNQDVVTDLRSLGSIKIPVNYVEVPVTVKDSRGRLVEALRPHDFAVFEDGEPQKLAVFISDPFPLTVAIVVDTDLPSETMKKVNESLSALMGAFSEFDEVALYRYGGTVQEVEGFTAATAISDSSVQRLKRTGRTGGAPSVGGPISAGPSINGHPATPGAVNPIYTTAPREIHVLNDAILRAATDMSRRKTQARRKVIIVISDGRESGSNAHYDEVRRVLLARNIGVYALGVDTASYPIYDRLNRIRIPGMGYGDLLPRYAHDSGGQTYVGFSREGIEKVYADMTEVARNQYTLGFYTRATPASNCHEIVVNVHRPDLIVRARSSYCPLPPQQ